ncbi:N-acetylglucosamine kinase [Cohnella thailandensis]|uniref:ATPase n=1 Tax=Cohnella thailandensis TaxID=557557 RepID=A0A841T351_9BACL|nr:BadF/BadG/BcrA/BcrD ATPase family protein [Cohnella thailandensis]MBB6637286.1 ATPase [Cohnella thailandensis]MBP1976614.1 glucosamine kinase [Cohnella thailandensis]
MENGQNRVIAGIDGGGTHTRVMIADLEGNILSYVERGASSLHKDLNAKENVRQAIEEALHASEKEVPDVAALAAGIAGFDSQSDSHWVEALTDLPGLHCRKLHVNDAVVAHSGALLSEPGIIVISGTGSIVFAITEDGKPIRNYDLHHYAASAARFLAYDATYELLAGNVQENDRQLVQSMLRFWGVPSVEQLSLLALEGFVSDERERNRKFAELAPTITEFALQRSSLARTVCDRAVNQIMVGIKILASYFAQPEVRVSLIGSVVNSVYFQQQLASRMKAGNNKSYRIVHPAFSPTTGALILALRQLGINITPQILGNLAKHPQSRYR